jgi:8-oxo-dGTP pyrophosphatase MutT (NUDIX family)
MIALDPAVAVAVVPRTAASVLILRDGDEGLQVLMVRRSPHLSFMPGAHVFPGGAVDPGDGLAADGLDEDRAAIEERLGVAIGSASMALPFAAAALRECFEECGLRLASSALQPWSHWLTPLGLPRRFDTLFFACRAPLAQQPAVDESETTMLAWVAPPQALAEHARGEFAMEFATLRIIESLLPFASGPVQALLDAAAARAAAGPLPLMAPRLQLDAQRRIRGILLPGQPGFDELPAG